MFVTMKSQINLKLVYVGSKSRSEDQILENPFIHSKGFIPVFMKLFFKMFICMKSRRGLSLGQVRLSCKSLGPRSNLGKSCVHSRGYSFDPIFMKLRQNINLHRL